MKYPALFSCLVAKNINKILCLLQILGAAFNVNISANFYKLNEALSFDFQQRYFCIIYCSYHIPQW